MAIAADVALSTCCSELRHQLVALNAPNTFNTIRNFGTLAALESGQNKAGIDPGLMSQLEANWGRGTLDDGSSSCKFKLWVETPNCTSSTEGVGTICNNSNTTGPIERRVQLDVTIEKSNYAEGRIRPVDFQCLCNGGQAEVLNREITNGALSILRDVNTTLATDVMAAMGNYTNAVGSLVSPATLNLLSASATGLYAQPVGWTLANMEYYKMRANGGYIALGGDLMYAYNSALNLAPTLSPGGYSLPNGVTSFYDPDVQLLADETLTAPLFTWSPGSLWLMRYLDNVRVEQNHINGANVSRTTVNLFGQIFDLSIVLDPACDQLRWVLNYQYELYALPDDAWGGDCVSTNHRQAYNIGCDVMDCADVALPAGA